MTALKPNIIQSTPIFWTPLPECQQELLSGGASMLTRPAPPSSDLPVTQ